MSKIPICWKLTWITKDFFFSFSGKRLVIIWLWIFNVRFSRISGRVIFCNLTGISACFNFWVVNSFIYFSKNFSRKGMGIFSRFAKKNNEKLDFSSQLLFLSLTSFLKHQMTFPNSKPQFNNGFKVSGSSILILENWRRCCKSTAPNSTVVEAQNCIFKKRNIWFLRSDWHAS